MSPTKDFHSRIGIDLSISVTVTVWCALDGHQWSLCLCCAMCFLLSIVCPLLSCHLIIVSVAPVSPSLRSSFVSLFTLQVSAVLCDLLFYIACVLCLTVQQSSACLFFPLVVVCVHLCFILSLKDPFSCI